MEKPLSGQETRYRRSTKAFVLLCLAAVTLAACNSSGEARKRDSDGRILPTLAEQDPTGTLYAASVANAARGNCTDQSFEVLTCFAYRGHGYEGAQTALGQCHLSSGEREEGLEWLRRAANAGWPDAQKLLASILAEEAENTGQEAAKWATLYNRNPALLSLGVSPDRSVTSELREKISAEDYAAGSQQARSWRPAFWVPDRKLDQEMQQSCIVEQRRQAPGREAIPRTTNTY